MSRRVYTVYRNFTTKHGTVVQTAVRTFADETTAKSVSEECHRDLMMAMRADLYMGTDKLGFNVGKLFAEIGIVDVSHTVGWAVVHDTNVVIEGVH